MNAPVIAIDPFLFLAALAIAAVAVAAAGAALSCAVYVGRRTLARLGHERRFTPTHTAS